MLKKILKFFLFLVLLYGFLGFVLLPFVIKSQVSQAVEKNLDARISLESVYFNPFIFRLKLSGIRMVDKEGAFLLSFDALEIDLEPHSLFKKALHLKKLLLHEPKILLVYNKDKSINLLQVVKQNKEEKRVEKDSETEFELPRIIIERVAIADGNLKYEDFTKKSKFDFELKKIGFELKGIDTKNFKSKDAKIRFYTLLDDGGFLDIKNDIVSLQPLVVDGSVDFEASKLYTEYRYMKDELKLEVADGKINFHTNYHFNAEDINSTKLDNMKLMLLGLRIKPKAKHADILTLKKLAFVDAKIKPFEKKVHLKKIGLDSLDIKAKRFANKKIDWLEYIKSEGKSKKQRNSNAKISKKKDDNKWDVVVDDISLENISFSFTDNGVKPFVKTKLNKMNVYVKDFTLKGEKSFSYKVDLKLNNDLLCNIDGALKHKVLDLNSYAKCSGLDIVKFRPYIDEAAKKVLSVYDVKIADAVLDFDVKISLKESKKGINANISDANVALKKVKITKRNTHEKLVEFKQFTLRGIDANTIKKDIKIKKTLLKNFKIYVKANSEGSINLENIAVAKQKKKTKKHKTSKSKPYRVRIKEVAISNAKIDFRDMRVSPSVNTLIDRFYLNGYNIDSRKWKWLTYYVSARVNHKGYIKAKGRLRHTPLKQKGSLSLKEISLSEFSPYLQQSTYLMLDRGYVDLQSRVSYEKSSVAPDLKLYGDLNIYDFFLNDTRDNSSLLSFNSMKLNNFEYEMNPQRAFVNELDIDGFYVNAVIDQNKTINFATLSKNTQQNVEKSSVSNSSDNSKKQQLLFKVMKIGITSGSAKFADLSLPIKFKTDIHDLNGDIYALSSQKDEVSYVDMAGEIDKYGSMKLRGSIDSARPKSYTDLRLNFRNLDLSSMSGYSASFAGYKIDDGKLFLDLGYEVVDSQLLGKNSIIIKKIKLGDKIEDENVSSLPLGLAIALLEDSEGIIDIDMPVEGNVDAPDFKYGALIWKTLGNLIVKAVASPFKFLGSILGIDADKLENIEFESGSLTILPPEREKLDKIVKLMKKRPKISLRVTPTYDKKQDEWVLKQMKFSKAMIQRSDSKNAKEHQNSMNIDILQSLYKELYAPKNPKDIKDKLSKKYKGLLLQRAYLKALVKECTKAQRVSSEELENLAVKRANTIKKYIVNTAMIDKNRIIIDKIRVVKDEKDGWIKIKLNIDISNTK